MITEGWEQPEWGVQTDTTWSIYTLEYFSALKRTWMDSEHMVLCEKPDTHGHTVCNSIYGKCLEQAHP